MRPAVTSLVLALAACTMERATVTVESAGVSLSGTQVSVGAVLRATSPVRDLEIQIELRDTHGATVARTIDSLDACAGTCPWGGTFVGEQFGVRWRQIKEVVVVASSGEPGPAEPPASVTVRRDTGGNIVGRAPGAGTIHVVARTGGSVSGGAQLRVEGDESFAIPAEQLPPAPGEELVAAFYASPPPTGD